MVKPFISIIIPAYNEVNRIFSTLTSLSEELSHVNFEYEVIIVDDGSRDQTQDIIQSFRAQIKNLMVIKNEENRGKGCAVKQGMLAAHGTWRLFMDADNATPFSEFTKMLPSLDTDHAILIGSRNIKGSVILTPQPWHRKILGRGGNFFIQFLFSLDISDTHCGFKCFREDAAQKIFSQAKINRWTFDDEILALAKKMGYPIKEIPVTWHDVKIYSTFKISDYATSFFDALRIKYWLLTKKYSL